MTLAAGTQVLPFGPSEPETSAPRATSARILIGRGFDLAREGDLYVIFLRGCIPLYHFLASDRPARDLAAVDLVRHHGVKVSQVATGLGIGRVTLHRKIRRFEEKGIQGLYPGKGRRMPTKIRDAVERRLLEMMRQGTRQSEAARRLGVTPAGVHKALRRLGWSVPSTGDQQMLPAALGESGDGGTASEAPAAEGGDRSVPPVVEILPGGESNAAQEQSELAQSPAQASPSEPLMRVASPLAITAATVDVNPLDRQGDRLMAKLGLLDDALPMFASAQARPRAGALLAVPLLVSSGIFDVAQRLYGSLGPAFYGLRTSVMMFLLMALLRIKRAEGLKEMAPPDLGHIVGLDRAPEVKTLRSKLKELAARGKGLEFLREVARLRADQSEDSLGFLYIDGHVRVYSGERHLPKTYVMQRRLALPATTDYWVNDLEGNPVFVVTAEANNGMTTMLPLVLKEVRGLIGDRRVTIVFDRGGWSPKLFRTLITDGWDILTYRKGKAKRTARTSFRKHTITIGGREISYELAARNVRLLGRKLPLRQVTVLGKHDHQTQILTNRKDLDDVEVAVRMFDRWRQENFFKYMLEEYALDALVDYGVEPADPTRTVPNPKRKALDKELKAARAVLAKLERTYGAAAIDNPETTRRTMRGFKIAVGTTIGKPLREARDKLHDLEARKKHLPARVPVADTLDGEDPLALRRETKRLSDTFKMVAYQTESALVSLVRPFYPRSEDEGRTLIASTFQSAGELTVTADELQVKLSPMSSPHRSRAIQEVCEQLNALGCLFPGTNLRLQFSVSTQ